MMRLAAANDAINTPCFMTIEELTTIENLNNAFLKTSKISHWKESTQRYKANLLMNNISLQEELRSGAYKTSPTTKFTICERGKLRNIEAPAMRDRVVQKVLCEKILIPQLTKYLIYDNYASLKDRGVAFARKRIDIFLRHFKEGYVLQIDIKSCFPSIDHEVLKRMLHDKIHEPPEIMNLIDYIVDTSSETSKGLNLGSEAPQIFAIFYLSRLDNYIKTVKRMKYYGRYMDDMIIFSESKQELKELLEDIKRELKEIKLEINEKKTHITKLSHGFTFLQIKYNINHGKIIKRPTRAKITRERRRLKKYKNILTDEDARNAYKSWRNSIAKDCKQSKRSIHNMDRLFDSLFAPKEKEKSSRKRFCNIQIEPIFEF